jgi:hypothetical protein
MVEIADDLKQHNPEVLDMISRCAADLGSTVKQGSACSIGSSSSNLGRM